MRKEGTRKIRDAGRHAEINKSRIGYNENKTQNKLLVLFATPHTFILALRARGADIYQKISENGVNIKLLIPRGAKIEEN